MSHLQHHQHAVGGGALAMVPSAPPPQQMLAGYTSSGSLVQSDGGSSNEYETMDVSVSVLGLTGIICDALPSKNKKSAPKKGSAVGVGGKPPTPQRKGANSAGAAAAVATEGRAGKGKKMMKSSSTSIESANTSTTEGSGYSAGPHADGIPTSAVVTFYRNVSASHSAIASHIPSSPLALPTSAFGNTSRYMASWPSGDPALGSSAGAEMSSFKFSRVMKREVIPGRNIDSASTMYVPEKVRVKVGLVCGSEVLELGVATLLVTGNEMGEVQVNLPIRSLLNGASGGAGHVSSSGSVVSGPPPETPRTTTSGGGFGSKFRVPTGRKSSSKKQAGMAAFKSDPSRYYKLDETAALRLLVRAAPRRDDEYGMPPPRPGRIDTRFDTPNVYNGRFNVDYQSIVSSLNPEESMGAETPFGKSRSRGGTFDDSEGDRRHHPPPGGGERTTAAVKEVRRSWKGNDDSWSEITPHNRHPREIRFPPTASMEDEKVERQKARHQKEEKITPRRKASAQGQKGQREREQRRRSGDKQQRPRSGDKQSDPDRHGRQTTRASNRSKNSVGRSGSSVSSVGMGSRTGDKRASSNQRPAQAKQDSGGCEGGLFGCGGFFCGDEDDDATRLGGPQAAMAAAEGAAKASRHQQIRGASTYGDDSIATATLSHTPYDVHRNGGSSESGSTDGMTTHDTRGGHGRGHGGYHRGRSFETGTTGFTGATGITSAYYASASESNSDSYDDTEEKTLNTFGMGRRVPPPHNRRAAGGGSGLPRHPPPRMRDSFAEEESDAFVHGSTRTSDRERRRNIKKAKEKLRRYAEQMGVNPEDLV